MFLFFEKADFSVGKEGMGYVGVFRFSRKILIEIQPFTFEYLSRSRWWLLPWLAFEIALIYKLWL